MDWFAGAALAKEILPLRGKFSTNVLRENTLFLGKVARRFEVLPSTNTYAVTWAAKSRPPEGSVVIAANQTEGRGQLGRSWVSAPAANCLQSVILYPGFLPARRHFLLTQAAALAVSDLLIDYLGPARVRIKWPNDCYIDDRKVAGILIQTVLSGTQLQTAVVGIGLNVLQRDFGPAAPRATSLALALARPYNLDTVRAGLFQRLEQRYLQLKAGKHALLQRTYLDRLYRLDQPTDFVRTADRSGFRGTIRGISSSGKLVVESPVGKEHFGMGEVGLL